MADLSQSVIFEVRRNIRDEQQANEVLDGIRESLNKENEKRISELSTIFGLKDDTSRDLVIEALKQSEWNVENAIAPLFELLDKQKKDMQKELEEKRRTERKAQAMKDANVFLKTLFQAVPEDKIQELLEQNDGDVNETTEQLLKMVAQQEEKASPAQDSEEKKRDFVSQQQDLEHQLKIEAVKKSFPSIERKVIVKHLKKHDWDVPKSTADLLVLEKSQKNEQLATLYEKAGGKAESRSPKPKPEPVKVAKKEVAEKARIVEQEIKAQQEQEQQSDPREIFKKQLEERLRGGPCPGLIAPPSAAAAQPAAPNENGQLVHPSRPSPRKSRAPPSLHFKAPDAAAKAPEAPNKAEKKVAEAEAAVPPQAAAQAEKAAAKAPPAGAEAAVQDLTSSVRMRASPEWADDGCKEIKVSFDTGEDFPVTPKDWIAMYHLGATEFDWKKAPKGAREFITYDWTNGARQGIVTFATPTTFGRYFFQMFTQTASGWKAVGISDPVYVGPKMILTVELPEDVKTMPVRVKATATIMSSTMLDFPSNAWIGLYLQDSQGVAEADNNRRYTAFQWLSAGKTSDQDDVKVPDGKALHILSKELVFEVPKAGFWQLRLFSTRYDLITFANTNLAGENSLRLSINGPVMTVHCSINTVDPATDYVWVGVYRVEEENMRQYRRYKYLTASGISSFSCKTPIHAGTYEARLFAHQSYEVLAKSEPVHIEGI